MHTSFPTYVHCCSLHSPCLMPGGRLVCFSGWWLPWWLPGGCLAVVAHGQLIPGALSSVPSDSQL